MGGRKRKNVDKTLKRNGGATKLEESLYAILGER